MKRTQGCRHWYYKNISFSQCNHELLISHFKTFTDLVKKKDSDKKNWIYYSYRVHFYTLSYRLIGQFFISLDKPFSSVLPSQ